MKVCGGCEAEYEEAFKFCPECGRAFGGEQAAQEKERLNQHLRSLAASGGAELRREQALRSESGFNSPVDFPLSEATEVISSVLFEQMAAGMPGTAMDDDRA